MAYARFLQILVYLHRDYLYLPFFFKKYYPALDINRDDLRLKRIANEFSALIYPDSWNKKLGIIKFNKRLGQIKAKHISKSNFKRNRHIDYFIKKNPGYVNGDELVCMAEVDIDNLLRFPKIGLVDSINSNEH